MSLIADSLKKALRTKDSSEPGRPAFNLIAGNRDLFKDASSNPIVRTFVLIGLPGLVLAYLISAGAFGKSPANSSGSNPLLKVFELFKSKPPPRRVPTPAPAPMAPAPAAPPVVAEAPKAPVAAEPFVPPLEKTPDRAQPPAPAKREAEFVPPTPHMGKSASEELSTLAPIEPPMAEPNPKPKLRIQKAPVAPAEKPQKKTLPPRVYPETITEHVALLTPPATVQFPARIPESESQIREPAPAAALKDGNYYFNLGSFYFQSGDMKKALGNFQRAAETAPNNPDVHNNIGLIYKELKRYDEAIEQFVRATFIDPSYVQAYNNIGVVYYLMGNLQNAVSNYQKAIEIKPDNLETYNNLGIIYKKQNQMEKAEAILNKALSLDPKHPGTNYNMAVLYEERGKMQPAIHFYRRFMEFGANTHPTLVDEVRSHLKDLS